MTNHDISCGQGTVTKPPSVNSTTATGKPSSASPFGIPVPRQDAEDILQETFVRAFKALPSFDLERGTGFAAWIGRIGLHQTLELLRKRKRERRDLIIPLSGWNIRPPCASLLLAGKSRRDRPNHGSFDGRLPGIVSDPKNDFRFTIQPLPR